MALVHNSDQVAQDILHLINNKYNNINYDDVQTGLFKVSNYLQSKHSLDKSEKTEHLEVNEKPSQAQLERRVLLEEARNKSKVSEATGI